MWLESSQKIQGLRTWALSHHKCMGESLQEEQSHFSRSRRPSLGMRNCKDVERVVVHWGWTSHTNYCPIVNRVETWMDQSKPCLMILHLKLQTHLEVVSSIRTNSDWALSIETKIWHCSRKTWKRLKMKAEISGHLPGSVVYILKNRS
jgi:hypothetical protein